jgi:hypothetical protein
MNKILAKSKLKKTGEDEGEKKKLFTDEDATWVSVSTSSFNSTHIELLLSFQKHCLLPKDQNRRSLQVCHPLLTTLCSSVSLSVFVSVCLSVSLSVSLCLSLSLSVSVYLSVSLCLSLSLSISLYLSVSLCLSLSLSVSLLLYLSLLASVPLGQIKSIARLLQHPTVIPDPEETNYAPLLSGEVPQEGLVEIIIDDLKRILTIRQDWAREACTLIDCTLRWEEIAERYKRISSGGVDDEATVYLQLGSFTPHRNYRFKVMVNMRYRPPPNLTTKSTQPKSISLFGRGQDDPNEIRLSRAGYVSLTTGPHFPHAPVFLPPDLIHFDHKVSLEKAPFGTIPSHLPRTRDEEIENLVEEDGVSVVDKLERYKEMINDSKKTGTRRTNRSSQTSDSQNGSTERRVSCRLQWTVPYSNGNSVIEYQIQKR